MKGVSETLQTISWCDFVMHGITFYNNICEQTRFNGTTPLHIKIVNIFRSKIVELNLVVSTFVTATSI